MPPGAAAKWWVWLVAIIVLIAIFVWRQGDTGEGGSDNPPERASVPIDCPQHEIAIDTNGPLPGPIVNDIPIASESDEIPEFHDCQRFTASTSSGYGPLIAIWSSTALARAFDPPPTEARAESAGTAARAPTTAPLSSPWVPVAQVYNFDDAEYGPLGIRFRFNCLYLREVPKSTSAPDGWIARMVPLHSVEGCLRNREATDTSHLVGTDLLVKATRPAAAEDLPPVVRWDREPADSVRDPRQYVSIRCRDQWCEIGPRGGFIPSIPVVAEPAVRDAYLNAFQQSPAGSVADAQKMRVIRAKGWYDQQLLATTVGSAKTLTRSTVFGTIIPHPTLDSIKTEATFDGRWLPAAYVYVSDAYTGKIRFERGMNRVFLCRSVSSRPCPSSGPIAGAAATPPAGGEWFAIISGATVSDTIRIHYDGSPGVIPAGAARWRWMETDESAWVRCAGGCCSSN